MLFPPSQDAQHLCVLVHGLWGNPNHLEYMANALREKHPQENLHILVAKRNSGSFTYDGIERGGERVTHEIEEEVAKLAEAGQAIKKISLVGYSLGGLVARYACGLLYSKGFFDKIQPINFTTFASPHLGVRTPLRGWHNHIWNVLGARTLSASGRQLFTIDSFRNTGKPLLEILAEPDSIFIKGLALFERRTLYTNIVNDRSAVYYTTGISKTDPFTNLKTVKINYLKGYGNVILDPETPVAPADPESLKLSGGLLGDFQTRLRQLPLVLAAVIFIPFGVVAFLLNSVFQSLRSNRRIMLHERGLAGIQPGNYRVPLLITGMREAVEDVYENLNSAQSNEYLAEGSEEETIDEPGSSILERVESSKTNGSAKGTELEKTPKHEIPTLALAPYQFRMIKTLDAVGWRKFPVHIHDSGHSHAAIIVRIPTRKSLHEGKIVIKHWLDREFIL